MNLAILTTQTPHHTYFVREFAKHFDGFRVFCETEGVKPQFPVAHSFEADRDRHEMDHWFDGRDAQISEYADTIDFASMNSPKAVAEMRVYAPDAVVVFGTGKLRDEIIADQPDNILNLHGGDPQAYRGLDTHLWAIYHNEYHELVTTLHYLNATLDDGNIVLQQALPISAGMKLHQLRQVNAEVCLELAVLGMHMLEKFGKTLSRPQRKIGRYYSFMPDVLKEICVKKFEKYTEKL